MDKFNNELTPFVLVYYIERTYHIYQQLGISNQAKK